LEDEKRTFLFILYAKINLLSTKLLLFPTSSSRCRSEEHAMITWAWDQLEDGPTHPAAIPSSVPEGAAGHAARPQPHAHAGTHSWSGPAPRRFPRPALAPLSTGPRCGDARALKLFEVSAGPLVISRHFPATRKAQAFLFSF